MKVVLIFFVCLLMVKSENPSFSKLTFEENQQRLERCGRHKSDVTNFVVRLTKQQKKEKGDNIWNYPGFLGVLVSDRHIIFGHERFKDFNLDMTKCRHNVPFLSPDLDFRFYAEFVGISKTISTKRYYYGNCEKTDGIIIVELEEKVNFTEACFPVKGSNGIGSVEDYDGKDVYENEGQKKETVLMDNREAKRPLTAVNKIKGVTWKCEKDATKYCYHSYDITSLYNALKSKSEFCLPLFHKQHDDERYFFIGLGGYWETTSLRYHAFRKEIDVICDLLGICPPPPTTTTAITTSSTLAATTVPLTTTARTTTTTVNATVIDHVPEFLYDEEARDFEEPYNKTSRRRKGADIFGKLWTTLGFMVLLIFYNGNV
ncbi:hypothetical protein B9Z55_008790 [Caenorhabditis nigoni]|nr:hypothetical protein B9Z55_008790 [Caenorhabditis nigoni]